MTGEMAGWLLFGGVVSVTLLSPIYMLLMWWLDTSQRVLVFGLIGVILTVASIQIYQAYVMQPHAIQTLGDILGPPALFALTAGWFGCGFLHAIVALCKGGAPQEEAS